MPATGVFRRTVPAGRRLASCSGSAWMPRAGMAAAKILGFSLLTLYGWLLFRADSFAQVATFTRTLLTGAGGLAIHAARPGLSAAIGLGLLGGWELAQYSSGGNLRFYQRLPAPLVGLIIAMMVFLILMGTSNEPAQFIYFQF